MSVALAEVELSKVQDDSFVHFGDLLQLLHVNTGVALAGDVNDKVSWWSACPAHVAYTTNAAVLHVSNNL